MDPSHTETAPGGESKRDFLKVLLGGGFFVWLGTILYPLVSYLRPPAQPEVEVTSVKVGPLAEIQNESGKIVRFGKKPVIVIKLPDGNLRAFDATCTHLDCTVQYKKDKGIIWCACHNGQYGLNGRNIGGPPPKPLGEYRVVIKDGDVFVGG
jgi:Rieske Fe-S protein